MVTALVFGWYGRGNVGDELMAQSLRSMFEPLGVKLKFIDTFTTADVTEADAVIMGGGCILNDAPKFEPGAWELLSTNQRPVFYVGIGFETKINEAHRTLMNVSRVVVTRSPSAPTDIPNAHGMPDLAYALPQCDPTITGDDVLIIPNVETMPFNTDPHWAHLGWERFTDEFSQFLDVIFEERKISPTFLLMCKNEKQDDRWAAHELISRMKNRLTSFNIIQGHADTMGITSLISSFKVVITQRYHGIILAQMSGVPHVSIDHHDKLKLAWPRTKGISIAYHGITKASLLEAYKLAETTPREQTRVPRELYDKLAVAIVSIIEKERETRVEQVRRSP